MAHLQVQGLHKTFDAVTAVNDLSFDVQRNEICAIAHAARLSQIDRGCRNHGHIHSRVDFRIGGTSHESERKQTAQSGRGGHREEV